MPKRSLVAIVLAAAVLLATPAFADYKLTLESHQDAFEVQGKEQPAHDKTVTMWVGDDAVARDDGESLVIVRGDKLYLVNHESRSYNVLDLPVDVIDLVPEEQRQQVRKMQQTARLDAEVTPSDESQEIGDWTARRYDVELSAQTGLRLEIVIWASDEVPVDPAANRRLVAALASLQPGGADWVDATAVIDGFPVRRETTMHLSPDSSVTTTEELVKVEEMAAPEGIYGPPKGYEEAPFGAGATP